LAAGDIFAFRRQLGDQTALVVFNRGLHKAVVDLEMTDARDEGRAFAGVWHGAHTMVDSGAITNVVVPARDAVVLVSAA
jgi:hypothetical protein